MAVAVLTDSPLASNPLTLSYTKLAQDTRELGLQGRTRWFYWLLFAGLTLALAGVVTASFFIGHNWWQLALAAALGVIFTQFAFFGHEASHRQVLASGPANDRLGRVVSTLLVGISYHWWMNKHSRHHGNPNKLGKDPDLDVDTFVFTPETAAKRRGPAALFTRHQGWFFYPMLVLEGLNLHIKSIWALLKSTKAEGRTQELVLLSLRFSAYLALVFWLLPVGMAFAFLGVQFAVFGVYMGSMFAPNHIGMPLVSRESKLDFLRKQVLTSRNISGGWWMTALMGGLNYQIEHHLFPSMPRPHLAKARALVLEHCRQQNIPYTETSLVAAWGIVARYLNEVGLNARHSFQCPITAAYRQS